MREMTDEQCIQIINLWGWHKHPQGWYDGDFKIGQLNYARDEKDWIKRKVNSWEGFGRTVEVMAGKKLSPDDLQELSVIYEAYLAGSITHVELWEATHIAALWVIDER